VSVVGRVEEFPSVAPFIALGHRVGHHAVCGSQRKSCQRRVIIEAWFGSGGESLYDQGELRPTGIPRRDACSLMSTPGIQARGGRRRA
jgi:hypothetical protein